MTSDSTKPKSGMDKLVKWGFLAVAVVAAFVVWRLQLNPPILEGWGTDLPAAQAQGKAQSRPVLIFFHDSPMNEISRQVVKHFTRPASMKAYDRYNYIRVAAASSKIAQDWGITVFPTLVVLDALGKEAGRHSGFIPEADFYDRFLPLCKGGSGGESATTGPRP